MEQQDLKDLFRPEGPVLPRLQPAASHHWRGSVRVPVKTETRSQGLKVVSHRKGLVWVNYNCDNHSLTWIVGPWMGMIPRNLTMIPGFGRTLRSWWNLPRNWCLFHAKKMTLNDASVLWITRRRAPISDLNMKMWLERGSKEQCQPEVHRDPSVQSTILDTAYTIIYLLYWLWECIDPRWTVCQSSAACESVRQDGKMAWLFWCGAYL